EPALGLEVAVAAVGHGLTGAGARGPPQDPGRGRREPGRTWRAGSGRGALDRIRTYDLLLRRQTLYPLSYEGVHRRRPSTRCTRLPARPGCVDPSRTRRVGLGPGGCGGARRPVRLPVRGEQRVHVG